MYLALTHLPPLAACCVIVRGLCLLLLGRIFGEFAWVSALGGVLRGLVRVLEARCVLPEGFGGKGHEAAAHRICRKSKASSVPN